MNIFGRYHFRGIRSTISGISLNGECGVFMDMELQELIYLIINLSSHVLLNQDMEDEEWWDSTLTKLFCRS